MTTLKNDYKEIYNRFNASPNFGNTDVDSFEDTLTNAFRTMVANGYNPRDILSLGLSTMSVLVSEEVILNACKLYEKENEPQ